jgi:hypothetical protein
MEAMAATDAPKTRCAIAKIHSLNPSAADSSILYHTPHCITGHTTATKRIPPAITSERLRGSRRASTAIAVPKALATVMCTASPMTRAGALKVPFSGADR